MIRNGPKQTISASGGFELLHILSLKRETCFQFGSFSLFLYGVTNIIGKEDAKLKVAGLDKETKKKSKGE